MTRQEVINAFPKDDLAVSIFAGFLFIPAIVLIAYAIYGLVNYFPGKKMKAMFSVMITLGCALFVLAIVQIGVGISNTEKYPELKKAWVQDVFLPYFESLEEIKIPIFQSKWNNKGNIDLILDTDTYKKTQSDIPDFEFYETTDPQDKGYIIIKDLGNVNDFPSESLISDIYEPVVLVDTFLPKRELEVK